MNVALKVENSVTENLRESALTSHLVGPRQLYCHYDQADRFNSASALLQAGNVLSLVLEHTVS